MIHTTDLEKQEYLIETLEHLLAKAKKELKELKAEHIDMLNNSIPADPELRDIF